MSRRFTRIVALVTILCMLFSVEVFAGKGSSCSGHKKGFFAKVGAAIKNTAKKVAKAAKCAVVKTGKAIKTAAKKTGEAVKNAAVKTGKAIKCAAVKTGKAIKVAGAKINNAVKDSGVWIKWKLTGKKKRVWVCGHYDKNGVWVKGHWRKLTPKEADELGCGNNPGQSNNPGQGNNPGQDNNPGQTEPLPMPPGEVPPADVPSDDVGQAPDAPPADEVPPADVPSDDAGQGDDAPPADIPSDDAGQVPDAPPADVPSDDAGQGSQSSDQADDSDQASQSDDASQAQQGKDEEVSLRTLGMLMNDLVKDSREITGFKKTAYENPGMNYSMEVQGQVYGLYESREQNAALLVKVIVYDLNQNSGKAGKYFSFFTHKMDGFDKETRKLIGDVLDQVKEGVQHNSNHSDNDKAEKAFAERMKELNRY